MDWEIMELYPKGRELEGKSKDSNILYYPSRITRRLSYNHGSCSKTRSRSYSSSKSKNNLFPPMSLISKSFLCNLKGMKSSHLFNVCHSTAWSKNLASSRRQGKIDSLKHFTPFFALFERLNLFPRPSSASIDSLWYWESMKEEEKWLKIKKKKINH